MPLQKVTLEVDVPEGYEATGEWRWPRTGEPALTTTGRAFCAHADDECGRRGSRIILRKLPDPVEEWLAQHPWLPEGCYVYRCQGELFISRWEPHSSKYGYRCNDCGRALELRTFAAIAGKEFYGPPVDCLQVKRS